MEGQPTDFDSPWKEAVEQYFEEFLSFFFPEELELHFTEALDAFEKEATMPYVTSIERRGIQKGIEQGILQKSR